MSTYSDKLKDPRWQKKRLEILSRDNWKCHYCDDTKTTLNVHHEKYFKNPWEINSEFLKTVCEVCHEVIEEEKKLKKTVLHIERRVSQQNQELLISVFSKKIDSDEKFVTLYSKDKSKKVVYEVAITMQTIQRFNSILSSL
jgi:phage terminase large subunit GpA-like protein